MYDKDKLHNILADLQHSRISESGYYLAEKVFNFARQNNWISEDAKVRGITLSGLGAFLEAAMLLRPEGMFETEHSALDTWCFSVEGAREYGHAKANVWVGDGAVDIFDTSVFGDYFISKAGPGFAMMGAAIKAQAWIDDQSEAGKRFAFVSMPGR